MKNLSAKNSATGVAVVKMIVKGASFEVTVSQGNKVNDSSTKRIVVMEKKRTSNMYLPKNRVTVTPKKIAVVAKVFAVHVVVMTTKDAGR